MISKKEVAHIAKLARLGLKEKEIERMEKELSVILDYVEKLKEVDISKVQSYLTREENAFRNDIKRDEELERRKKLLEMTPEKSGNYIKVKSILK